MQGFEIRMEDLVREEQQEALTQKQPVEFDQAINYVNKIKDRFRFREGVYKNFLEILNQYRKAQKGIKEVYDQVSNSNSTCQKLEPHMPWQGRGLESKYLYLCKAPSNAYVVRGHHQQDLLCSNTYHSVELFCRLPTYSETMRTCWKNSRTSCQTAKRLTELRWSVSGLRLSLATTNSPLVVVAGENKQAQCVLWCCDLGTLKLLHVGGAIRYQSCVWCSMIFKKIPLQCSKRFGGALQTPRGMTFSRS